MSKQRNKASKGLVATLILLGSAIFVNAQSSTETAWPVSKDVQRVANKKLFEDRELSGSHIHAVVLSPTWNISKGVNSIGRTADVGQGNVRSTGIPDIAISKGVQRIQKKKSASPQLEPVFKREQEITRN